MRVGRVPFTEEQLADPAFAEFLANEAPESRRNILPDGTIVVSLEHRLFEKIDPCAQAPFYSVVFQQKGGGPQRLVSAKRQPA
jgi:hypothetical protein